MRSRTRTVFTLLVALAMVVALAPAALAGRGDKPEKPGKGNSAISVEIETIGVHDPGPPYVYEEGALGYPFYWVNAMGDQLRYVVTVSGLLSGTVEWDIGSHTGTQHDVAFADPDTFALVPFTLVHAATEAEVLQRSIEATFTVSSADGAREETVTMSTPVEFLKDCEDVGLVDESDGDAYLYKGTPTETCRWVPAVLGDWRVELTPEHSGRPVDVMATLRDHMPGNWCGAFSERTRGGSVFGTFHLPDTGICLGGGAGGDTMAVGSTTDFVLVTNAHIRLTHP